MRYNIIYSNQFGGNRFEELPNETIFNLKAKNEEGIINVSKSDLMKYKDSFISILVRWKIDGYSDETKQTDEIKDIIIEIESFNKEDLEKIIFFYKNDYFDFNEYSYYIPKIDGEKPNLNDLIMFLGLPSDAKTLSDFPDELDEEEEEYYDDQYDEYEENYYDDYEPEDDYGPEDDYDPLDYYNDY